MAKDFDTSIKKKLSVIPTDAVLFLKETSELKLTVNTSITYWLTYLEFIVVVYIGKFKKKSVNKLQ